MLWVVNFFILKMLTNKITPLPLTIDLVNRPVYRHQVVEINRREVENWFGVSTESRIIKFNRIFTLWHKFVNQGCDFLTVNVVNF